MCRNPFGISDAELLPSFDIGSISFDIGSIPHFVGAGSSSTTFSSIIVARSAAHCSSVIGRSLMMYLPNT